MEYRIISADSHVDMTWLPGYLFCKSAPVSWKDQVPKVVETAKGLRWVAEDKELGVVGGVSHGFTPPKRGESKRTDRMLDIGFYRNGAAGKPHPTIPELRLADMTLDGVWPDSRDMGHLTESVRHKIVCGNTGKLYRFTN